MKTLKQAVFKGRRVLVRVDFNVPLDPDGKVTDDLRIQAALPTLQYILSEGGSLVLMSHLGRPKGNTDPALSLKHILPALTKLLGREVAFADDCISNDALKQSHSLQPGEVLLLENLRFHAEEKSGGQDFARLLAKHGEIYVNDAFGTAHRAHASTATVAQFFNEKYAGFLLQKEIETAEKVLKNPARPFTAIMGGAKVSDKIQVIERLLEKTDNLLIGGGMAYTFLKAKGYEIGKSLLEKDKVAIAAALLKKARRLGVTILTPVDAVVADKFSPDAQTAVVRNADFPKERMGLDIGPETFQHYKQVILQSKTILWNGPMGVFEMAPFAQGTFAIAKTLASATERGSFTLVGGGDSAAAIRQMQLDHEVSYVSTGGGALLEYLEGKELPGVTALSD